MTRIAKTGFGIERNDTKAIKDETGNCDGRRSQQDDLFLRGDGCVYG